MIGLSLSVPPVLDAEVADEDGAIRRAAELLRGLPAVTDFEGFLAAVYERQRINPPVLGNGVALPHARTPRVGQIVFAALRCREPVVFGGDKPVRLVFLFGVPPAAIAEYLGMTAALVRRLRDPRVLEGLNQAGTADEFERWLTGEK